MRDMHDGLGSSLMSSLALAERGESDHEFVLGTLREAVDEGSGVPAPCGSAVEPWPDGV